MSSENTSSSLGEQEFSDVQPLCVSLVFCPKQRLCFRAGCQPSPFLLRSFPAVPEHLQQRGGDMPTMVLSETRGLWLCWVVRGGIRWPMRLSAKAQSLTRPRILTLDPSTQGPGTDAVCERSAVSWALKLLVISVVPDRNVLLSSTRSS